MFEQGASFTQSIDPMPPPSEPTPLQRRRINFFRAERFSLSERGFFPPDFDPGPEYDAP